MFWAEKRSEKLGGPGRTVEIDEAKIGRRKYNRGRLIKGQWIFGGYERDSKKIFIVPVEDRTGRNTLGMHQGVDHARNNNCVRLLEVLQLFKQ